MQIIASMVSLHFQVSQDSQTVVLKIVMVIVSQVGKYLLDLNNGFPNRSLTVI